MCFYHIGTQSSSGFIYIFDKVNAKMMSIRLIPIKRYRKKAIIIFKVYSFFLKIVISFIGDKRSRSKD